MRSVKVNEVNQTSIPKRSILYNIEPIGIGTPCVESLTSYIIRLAYYHNISVRDMVYELIGPEMYNSSKNIQTIIDNSKNINGFTVRTREMVRAIQKLTSRKDLSFHTLLILEDIFSPTDALMRKYSYWCPLCYQDWESGGKIIYDPLLWKIRFIFHCDRHLIPLENECPYCKKQQKVLTSNSVSGYCPHCKEFLGNTSIYSLDSKQKQSEIWTARIFTELLGKLFEIDEKKSEIDINHSISLLIQSVSDRNIQSFSRISGINENTIRQWNYKKAIPTFELVLILCINLEITISQLLLMEVPLNKVIKARNNIKSKNYVSIYNKDARKKVNKEEMKTQLEKIMLSNESPPPSLSEVAKRLERHHSHIKRLFPELSNQIISNNKEYLSTVHQQNIKSVSKEVRDITITLHSKGIYPSISQLRKYLSKPGYLKNPKIVETYYQIRNELGHK